MDCNISMVEWIEAELSGELKQPHDHGFYDGNQTLLARHRKVADRRSRRDYLLNAYEELLSNH